MSKGNNSKRNDRDDGPEILVGRNGKKDEFEIGRLDRDDGPVTIKKYNFDDRDILELELFDRRDGKDRDDGHGKHDHGPKITDLNVGEFVRVDRAGGDAQVWVDLDGAGTAHGFVLAATLKDFAGDAVRFEIGDKKFTLNVNDAPTAVNFANATTAVNESAGAALGALAALGIKVADIAVVDDNLGTEILALVGADKDFFEIVGNALYLKAGVEFDYETKSSYSVQVTADDPTVGGTPDAISDVFTVNVTDVNEAPVLTVDQTPVEAREDVDDIVILADVDATDPDTRADTDTGTANDTFNDLTFSIFAGNDGGLFEIDAANGNFSLAAGKSLNYEMADSYTLTVRVTDGPGLFDQKTVTINVTDVNERPTLTVDQTPVEAREDVGDIVILADVDATDPDTRADTDSGTANDNYNDLTFSIFAGNDGELFEIDAANGNVSLAAGKSLNYETADSYTLTVRVTDGPGLFDQKTVTINVIDVNEAPTLTVDQTPVEAREDVGVDVILADVDATDPDTRADSDTGTANDTFNDLTFSIFAGNDGGLFEIDPTTGEISLAVGRKLDYEDDRSHTLTIRVTDGPGLSDEVEVTINVTDVNEGPNAGADKIVSVAEDVEDDKVLARVMGTDPDESDDIPGESGNEHLTYTIIDGNAARLFEIDEDKGEISLLDGKSLNFEAAQKYTLTVRVTDRGGEFDDALVTINVTDVNEAPSAGNDFEVSRAENVSDTFVLATVLGTDPDIGGGNDGDNDFEDLTYSFKDNDNDGGLFEIDSFGRISLVAGRHLDFEADKDHRLTVLVTDGPGLSDEVEVTINVTDVNAAPVFTSGTTALVDENISTSFVAYDADADDDGENKGELKYRLDGDDKGAFKIDEGDGEVRFDESPDFENPDDADGDNVYHIVVIADDGNLETRLAVEITVKDLEEDIVGTRENDDLKGTEAADTIIGLLGNDKLKGEGGDDLLIGDDRTVTGSAAHLGGNDEMQGDGGQDLMVGDFYSVLDGAIVTGGADDMQGGDSTDLLFDDGMIGDAFEVHNAKLIGGEDILQGDDGGDRLIGDAGKVTGTGNVEGAADELYGGGGHDLIIGDAELVAGDATLNGGDDIVMLGGDDHDALLGDVRDITGSGVVTGGNDNLDGEDGNDLLIGDADTVGAGASLTGGNDTLVGGKGNDALYGDARTVAAGATVTGGNDELDGGDDDDLLVGGPGDDFLIGGSGLDKFVFNNGDGDDTIDDFKLGEDVIDLTRVTLLDADGDGIKDFDDVRALMPADNSARAVINFDDGSSITFLMGIEVRNLTENDFILI
jgi:Cadherin domain/RTX calcium-binding nonapeptide repeat (4 copies)